MKLTKKLTVLQEAMRKQLNLNPQETVRFLYLTKIGVCKQMINLLTHQLEEAINKLGDLIENPWVLEE